jgi:DNA polymerase-1
MWKTKDYKIQMKKIIDYPLRIVEGLHPIATSKDRVTIDIEMFNMKKGQLHRPKGTFAFMGATLDGETVYYITDDAEIQTFIHNINDAVWIFQKGDFDIRQLRRWADIPNRKKYWDTMYMEKILFSGYYDSFSLQSLVRRWLHTYMDKDVRSDFEKATEMTEEMLRYSCMDVIATWHVYQAQRAYVSESDLKLWKEIDRSAVWTTLNMMGMMLDVDEWLKIAQENEEIVERLQSKYPDINLNSTQQVGRKLEEDGYKLPETKKGNKSTSKKVLERLETSEFVEDKLAFASAKKLASTYGRNVVENFVEADGRIWSNFNVNGAATSRFSSDSINLENIPKREGPRFRKCFVAGPGNVIIAPDYSSQEPRIGAYYSQDEVLIDIFRSKHDVYIESGRLMFGWELTKKDPRRSLRMKPTVLGAFYGLTAWGMKREYDIPVEEGEELLYAFFNVFKGVKEWIDKQQKKHDHVETLYGRKYWLNPYLDFGKSDRNSINSPIQGSAADMLKIAGYRIQDWYGWDKKLIVNWMHDEIVMECPETVAEEVQTKAIEIMIQVAEETHPGIPASVESYISKVWSEKQD